MAGNIEQVKALLRQARGDSAAARDEAKRLLGRMQALEAQIASIRSAFAGGANKPLTNRERALAAARDMRPSWFVINHTVSGTITAPDNTEKQTDTVGRFVIDRIRVAWRATSGSDSGEFGYLSQIHSGVTGSNIINWSVQFVDGRNTLHLQNDLIPGDLFCRSDGDGFPAGGLVLEPGSDFKVIVTPHVAWPSDGVLVFVFEGIQCYDQTGAP